MFGNSKRFINLLRWLSLPIIAAVAGYLVNLLWVLIGPRLVYPWGWPVAGALAAITYVFIGTLLAPNSNLFGLVTLYLFGVILAWLLLGHMYKPDSVTRTYVPIVTTYCAGVVALSLALYLKRKLQKHNEQRFIHHASYNG